MAKDKNGENLPRIEGIYIAFVPYHLFKKRLSTRINSSLHFGKPSILSLGSGFSRNEIWFTDQNCWLWGTKDKINVTLVISLQKNDHCFTRVISWGYSTELYEKIIER